MVASGPVRVPVTAAGFVLRYPWRFFGLLDHFRAGRYAILREGRAPRIVAGDRRRPGRPRFS